MDNRSLLTEKNMKKRSDYQGVDRVCEKCGTSYNDTVKRRIKFCSLKCWKESFEKTKYTCLYCKKSWFTRPNRNTKYCSRKCMFLYLTGKKRPEWIGIKIRKTKLGGKEPSTGREIRHLRQWSKCRNIVLKRDSFMCQMCFEGGIEVHHIKPVGKYPELGYEISNLITLCKTCHHKTYHKEKNFEDYFYKRLEELNI